MLKAIKQGNREAILDLLNDESIDYREALAAARYAIEYADKEIARKVIPIEERLSPDANITRLIEFLAIGRDEKVPQWFIFLIKCGADGNTMIGDRGSVLDVLLEELKLIHEVRAKAPRMLVGIVDNKFMDRINALTGMISTLVAAPRTLVSKEQKQIIIEIGLGHCFKDRKMAVLKKEVVVLRQDMADLRDEVRAAQRQ